MKQFRSLSFLEDDWKNTEFEMPNHQTQRIIPNVSPMVRITIFGRTEIPWTVSLDTCPIVIPVLSCNRSQPNSASKSIRSMISLTRRKKEQRRLNPGTCPVRSQPQRKSPD